MLKEIRQYSAPTPSQQKLYNEMIRMYPQEIILLAARECAAKQKNLDSVMKLLESWQERGFTDESQITDHIRAFHEKEEFLRSLRQKWTVQDAEIGQKTLQLLDKWENEMGFSREMISKAADLAFEVKKPVAYMDKTLGYWAEKGIRTPADVQKDRETHRDKYTASGLKGIGKTVAAQQYTQRDYTGEQEAAMERMIASIRSDSMNGIQTDGGDGHA